MRVFCPWFSHIEPFLTHAPLEATFETKDRVHAGETMKRADTEPRGAVIYQSPAVNWEIFTTDHPDAVINRVRIVGKTIFFVTDRGGRNFMHCTDMEDCYRIIEERFPWVMLDGIRSDGTIEIFHQSLSLTAPI